MFDAADDLISSYDAALGEEITVTDGGYTCPITATLIGDGRMVEDHTGGIVQWNGIAAWFTRSDLKFNGHQVNPKPGMKVTTANGDLYEVARPGGTQDCFEQVGTLGIMRLRRI